MPRVRAVLIAALLLAPAVAMAADDEDADWHTVRVTGPGVYVLSSCGIVGSGKTEAEARRAFERSARYARRVFKGLGRRCTLMKLTDVVRIAPGQKAAFFTAGPRGVIGTDRQEVIRRCRAGEEALLKAEPNVQGPNPKDCDRVHAAYGPFPRKQAWDEYDDARSFVYLEDNGYWVDDRAAPICFPAGTAIATPDGDRPIETLAAGNRVLSWSAERGAPVPARVLDVKRRRTHELLELTLADGRTLRVSANHPLFVPARNDWVAAGALRAGDELGVLADGKLASVAIKVVANRAVDIDVFDLTVETTHAYFAGGVLAHNY